MRKIKISIAYDGTHYHGWQKQKNAKTIQETLEKALEKICKAPIEIIGASRTDTGVHAKHQVAVFYTENRIPAEKLPYALNANLPSDVVVYHAEEVEENFHPRYDAKQKTYIYKIYTETFMDPMLRDQAYYVRDALDVESMQEAARHFIGTHDFSAFRTLGSSVKTTVRTIFESELTAAGSILQYKVCGDGFLYNMVRIIVGTLIDVGKGKILPNSIGSIIASKNRKLAGRTAPPQGLYLERIDY